MIKRFKKYIVEKLDDKQKEGLKNYARFEHGVIIPEHGPSRAAFNFSHHIMPQGVDSIVIPAMNSLVQRVHDHLKQHGYTMDYGNQLAYKAGRPTKIGKVLHQTNADKTLKDEFANDNHAESADFTNKYSVLISRNPHHIAECSTNKPWSSCAKLDDNGKPELMGDKGNELAAEKLPYDIDNGTHVAYLVHNTIGKTHQQLIDGAVGRILLKPHHTQNRSHSTLIPESKVYSTSNQPPSGFKETVNNFADTYFPMKTNTLYKKDDQLYDDDKQPNKMKIDLSTPIDTSSLDTDDLMNNMTNQRHIKASDITEFMANVTSNPNAKLLKHIPLLPHANDEHIKPFLHPDVWEDLPANTKTTIIGKVRNKDNHEAVSDHLFKDIHTIDYNRYPTSYIDSETVENYLKSPLTKATHIKKLLSHPEVNVDRYSSKYFKDMLLKSHKLNGNDLHELIDNSNKLNDNSGVLSNPNIEPSHVIKLLNTMTPNSSWASRNHRMVGLQNPEKTSAEHIHQILDATHNSNMARASIASSHFITNIHNELASNPNFNEEHAKKILDHIENSPGNNQDEYYGSLMPIASYIRNNNNTNHNNLYRMLLDRHAKDPKKFASVSNIVAYNTENFDKDTITKALSNNKLASKVHDNIAANSNLNHSHLLKLMTPDTFNRLSFKGQHAVLQHPKFTSAHMQKAVNNIHLYNEDQARAIVRHPLFNKSVNGAHFDKIVSSRYWGILPNAIQNAVLNSPSKTTENIQNYNKINRY